MADITMNQIKSLRERTGAGITDCKNALVEAEGNEEGAIEIIQKKGLAKVAKKAGAIAAEGLVFSYIHPGNRVGMLVEVNSQTDFVARSEDFQEFVKQLSMHIASEKPTVLTGEELNEAEVDKQKDIFVGQLAEEAKETGKEKPPEAIAKIVEGKLAKWKQSVVLLDQEFLFSEDKQTVAGARDALSAKLGEKISIRRFVRFELGEGIEKKVVDFAAEVAEQLG